MKLLNVKLLQANRAYIGKLKWWNWIEWNWIERKLDHHDDRVTIKLPRHEYLVNDHQWHDSYEYKQYSC